MLEKPKSLEDDMAEKEGDQAEGLRERFASAASQRQSNTPPMMYLGDSVYARYLNGMIGLALNNHQNPTLIWLDSEVMAALNQFHQRCKGE